MGLKKWIAKRLVNKFLGSSIIFDAPGFIYSKINVEDQDIFFRDIVLIETFLAALEIAIKDKYGKKGQGPSPHGAVKSGSSRRQTHQGPH